MYVPTDSRIYEPVVICGHICRTVWDAHGSADIGVVNSGWDGTCPLLVHNYYYYFSFNTSGRNLVHSICIYTL